MVGGGSSVNVENKDNWLIHKYSDGFVEAYKTFVFPSVINYSTFNGFGGYLISNIILPYHMRDIDYSVDIDPKIGTAFSIYAGSNKSIDKFDAIMLATSTGANKVTINVKVSGYINE